VSRRALFLDDAPGERRGVVMLDGRPERLVISRSDDIPAQQPGARSVGRLRRIDRALACGFVDLGEGPEAVLPLTGPARGLAEGAAVEVEVISQARWDKGAVVRLAGPAEGAPRLLEPAPPLDRTLERIAPGRPIATGAAAREAADLAEDAVLAVEHALPGGGVIAIEPTRALTAIDVDLAATAGDARQAARRANLAAIAEAARLLRLKSLGGLVVFDLVGARHDGEAIAQAARTAFEPDQPGVSIGPVSRLGLFQMALPRRGRPVRETLVGADGRLTSATVALRVLRGLEREGRADGGARLLARCAPAAAAAASPYVSDLVNRIGRRFEIRPEPGFAHDQIQIGAL
jgi:Ribonuclease G/E